MESTPGAEAGTRDTYREIGNDGFRVICSKREGESSEELTRVTERNQCCSKKLSPFLSLLEECFRFCFQYMQNSVWVFNSSVSEIHKNE